MNEPRPRGWKLFAKHQTGAVVATVLDFLTMIAVVELGRVNPVTATAIGAGVGALTNFLLGRRWVFHAEQGQARWQALRYALVATGSLGLNSLGQALALRLVGSGYVGVRVVIAALVGVSWNFPLHRKFVFRRARTPVAGVGV